MSRDLRDVHRRLLVGSVTILGLLLLAVSALALARRMQRSVSEPLLNLADTARRVSTTRDYSLRAAAPTRDEIGVVVRSFNEMLDQIAERTASSRRPTPNCSTRSRSANASSAIASWRWNASATRTGSRTSSWRRCRAAHADERRARLGAGAALDRGGRADARARPGEHRAERARAGTVDRGSPRNLAHCHGQAAPPGARGRSGGHRRYRGRHRQAGGPGQAPAARRRHRVRRP